MKAGARIPNGEPKVFRIGGETLDEFFDPKRGEIRVTRAQLQRILALYTSKQAVHDAMQVLSFELRQALKGMIAEERAAMEETKSEGGIILLPDR
jgi:hypothetical protein